MAKSIRSKRKRFLRSIKRQRYAVKELKRLKDMLGIKEDTTNADVEMTLDGVANVINFEAIQNTDKAKAKKDQIDLRSGLKGYHFHAKGSLVLDVDSDEDSEQDEPSKKMPSSGVCEVGIDPSKKRVYDSKTMKDQHGNYPPWFNSRDIRKHQKKEKLEARKKRLIETQNKKRNKRISNGRIKKTKRARKYRKQENASNRSTMFTLVNAGLMLKSAILK